MPTSKEILKKWLQKLNRPKFEPSFTSVICYRHFQDHDYVFSYVATENRQSRLKKILSPTAIPSLQLSTKNIEKVDNALMNSEMDMKPKENGWYSCSNCPNESSFLYFFEIMSHYREIHGIQTLLPNSRERTKYDKPMTPMDFNAREKKLSDSGWTCQICNNGKEFKHKFELVTHWLHSHSIQYVIYEACQWCSELFISTDSSAKVRLELFEFNNFTFEV